MPSIALDGMAIFARARRLDRLEKKRLIERIASDEDRRSLLVRLTSAGLKVIRLAYAQDMAIQRDLLSTLSSTERANLARLLMKLLVDLENRALPGQLPKLDEGQAQKTAGDFKWPATVRQ